MSSPQLHTETPDSMQARYRRAEAFAAGLGNSSLVQNDTLAPHWIRDTHLFWYERATKTGTGDNTTIGKQYRLVNAPQASNQSAFDHSALANTLASAAQKTVDSIDPHNLPITKVHIDLADDNDLDSLVVEFNAFEQRWCYTPHNNHCDPIAELPPYDQPVSPDGEQQVFVRDYNLWLRHCASGEERALTTDGEEYYAYGLQSGTWGISWPNHLPAAWSPDGSRVLTVRRDRRLVKTTPLVNNIPADGSIRPTVEHVKVAYPGDEHVETFEVLSIDIASGETVFADYRPMNAGYSQQWGAFSTNIIWWAKDNGRAYCIEMERGDRVLRLLEFNTHSGEVRVLFKEESPTHINLLPEFPATPLHRPLLASDELLWWSERSGWGHLYLYDLTTGELKQTVTSGEWLVRDVLFVDEARREAIIQTAGRVAGRNPYYRDLCRVNIDTGELTTIMASDEDIRVHYRESYDENTAIRYGNAIRYPAQGISSAASYIVLTRSRVDRAPVTDLINREGDKITALETAALDVLPAGWSWPEPIEIIAADGQTKLYGNLFRPSDFSGDKHYPVINFINGDPSFSVAAIGSFNSSRSDYGKLSYFQGLALAELGFMVLVLDSRGTPLRGKAFHDESYGWAPGAANTEDHAGAIQQLAMRYPEMDVNRVGIYSTGYHGGLVNFLERQDLYKVHVLGGALFDARMMGCSVIGDVWEGVEGPSKDRRYPEDLAEKLQGKVLIIHAVNDPQRSPCYPATIALRFCDALQRANKDFDMLTLPRSNLFYGPYVTRRIWDYLVEHLAEEEPPKDIRLNSSMVF